MAGCVESSSGIGELVLCENQCNVSRASCKNVCGPYELESPIQSIQYTFVELTSPKAISPLSMGPGVLQSPPNTNTIITDKVDIPDGYPSNFFVNAYFSELENACIFLTITVTFEDGRECQFNGSVCST